MKAEDDSSAQSFEPESHAPRGAFPTWECSPQCACDSDSKSCTAESSPAFTFRSVSAAIIERDGKILIAQRSKPGPLYGKWEFPGGKVEPGETLQQCLKRELLEELGIHAEIGDHFCTENFILNDKPCAMSIFRVLSFTGEPVLNDHMAMRWVTAEEMDNYVFPDTNLPIIQKLKKTG